jgi:hypothetical protein
MSDDTTEMIAILLSLAPWLIFIALSIWSLVSSPFQRPEQPTDRARDRSDKARGQREVGETRS